MSCNCKIQPLLQVKRLNKDAMIPRYETAGAAGFDLASAEEVLIYPGETKIIGTGLAVAIPNGWEMQIRPRSGMSAKTPIIAKNTVGTIDCDYRGEVKIILHNLDDFSLVGSRPYLVSVGDRIAQRVLKPAPQAKIIEVDSLDQTERGEGGFGHTGK
jgi:dUTP pyrophosphatase